MNHLYLSRNPQALSDLADLLLLISISLCPPTTELAGGVEDGSFLSDFGAAMTGVLGQAEDTGLQAARLEGDAQAIHHALNLEYTRLFTNPKRELVPLYESLIVHPGEKVSMFINPTAMHCEQTYRKSGFEFAEKNRFPGDHVGIELRYAACLLMCRAQAILSANENDVEATGHFLLDFVSSHLNRWMAAFAQQLARETTCPFYGLIADALGKLAPLLAQPGA